MAPRTKFYCINQNPMPWQRAGHNSKTNRFFDNQSREKLAFGIYMKQQHGEDPIFDTAISLDVTFYIRIPQFSSRTAHKKNGLYHSSRPDIDNFCKFLLDAMHDVVLSDDKLICSLSAKKIYSDQPRTEFTITELE